MTKWQPSLFPILPHCFVLFASGSEQSFSLFFLHSVNTPRQWVRMSVFSPLSPSGLLITPHSVVFFPYSFSIRFLPFPFFSPPPTTGLLTAILSLCNYSDIVFASSPISCGFLLSFLSLCVSFSLGPPPPPRFGPSVMGATNHFFPLSSSIFHQPQTDFFPPSDLMYISIFFFSFSLPRKPPPPLPQSHFCFVTTIFS